MNRSGYLYLIAIIPLLLVSLACGFSSDSTSEPKAAVAPITIGSDLTQIDICAAIPIEDIEAVMGRKLASAPQPFDYYETGDTSGCWYEAAKDSNGTAHFGYVALTPVEAYNNQPLYEAVDVVGIGETAYFNNGADARQLWVKMNDQVAFVVAFGDEPKEAGAEALAKLVAAAIK